MIFFLTCTACFLVQIGPLSVHQTSFQVLDLVSHAICFEAAVLFLDDRHCRLRLTNVIMPVYAAINFTAYGQNTSTAESSVCTAVIPDLNSPSLLPSPPHHENFSTLTLRQDEIFLSLPCRQHHLSGTFGPVSLQRWHPGPAGLARVCPTIRASCIDVLCLPSEC